MRGLLGHLGHPHSVLLRVEPVEGSGAAVQLVTQHQHKRAQLSHGALSLFCLRQASEQYLTSAQVFSHRLRQVMGRPQATQGLLGSATLLPRNNGGG